MAVFRGVEDVTIGFTLLHAGKRRDPFPALSGDDRSAAVPQQRDAASRSQTPAQPVS
jgi:hypothetical protein